LAADAAPATATRIRMVVAEPVLETKIVETTA